MRNFKKKGFTPTPERAPNTQGAKRSARLVWGFTLLETIVALGVLLAASVGPVSLITRGLADFTFSRNKLVAINLAQEGIELVRAIRDNNIVCDVLNGPTVWPWNQNPEPPYPPESNRFTSVNAGVAPDRNLTMDCGGIAPVAIVMPILSLSCSDKLRFDPATGLYGYTGPEETIFSRCVQINVSPAGPDSGIPGGDQMDIVSTVTWDERGAVKTLTLQERLFNWR